MIVSFEFENHHSYEDEQFFSMERPSNISLKRSSIDVPKYELQLSRVAAIYGANASGKSGFLTALQFLQRAVDTGWLRCDPFRLSRNHQIKNSSYSINFIAGNHLRYQYDLVCNQLTIVSESLAVWDSQKPSILFEGSFDDNQIKYKFGEKFTSKNIRKMVEGELNPDGERPLLHLLRQINEEVTRPAYDFLARGILICCTNNYSFMFRDFQKRAAKDEDLLAMMNSFLPAIDLGITKVVVDVPRPEAVDEFLKDRPDTDRDEFVTRNTRLIFQHSGDGADFQLSHLRESDGTIAAITLLAFAYDALRDGSVCAVDELDSSLHPLLVSQLVEVFNNSDTNPRNAQLIFTTHDTSIIERHSNENLLDRDQIWFAEKDSKGRSSLYSLIEMETPRDSENIGAKYLHGRYGATPNISLVHRIEQLIEKGKL